MEKKRVDELGYDLEEVYFAKKNHELLMRLKTPCPECAGRLETALLDGVEVLRCEKCKKLISRDLSASS